MEVGTASSLRTSVVRELTPEQSRQVSELRQIDRQVREHEAAHLRSGSGVVTSGASYSYAYGPDGKQYAVGGEVGIDTSPGQKPEANIDKGQRIQIAALAPRDPSPQDYRVASVGGQLEMQGRSDLSEQKAQERAEQGSKNHAALEGKRQQIEERDVAVAAQAVRTGEAQNIEPKAPQSDQNDAARQRVARAYQPPAVAAVSLSLFA